MARTVEELLAEAAIKDVHIRYCRANDRRDEELMRACFHPDAGVEAFLALGRQILAMFTVTWRTPSQRKMERGETWGRLIHFPSTIGDRLGVL